MSSLGQYVVKIMKKLESIEKRLDSLEKNLSILDEIKDVEKENELNITNSSSPY